MLIRELAPRPRQGLSPRLTISVPRTRPRFAPRARRWPWPPLLAGLALAATASACSPEPGIQVSGPGGEPTDTDPAVSPPPCPTTTTTEPAVPPGSRTIFTTVATGTATSLVTQTSTVTNTAVVTGLVAGTITAAVTVTFVQTLTSSSTLTTTGTFTATVAGSTPTSVRTAPDAGSGRDGAAGAGGRGGAGGTTGDAGRGDRPDARPDASGGTIGGGGRGGTGGRGGAGGVASSGGRPGTGGGSGGVLGTGGMATGGTQSTGGTQRTGGVLGSGGQRTGGTQGTGGAGTGGTTPPGSVPPSGCSEGNRTLTSNGTGQHCGYTYEYWKDSGSGSLVLTSDGFNVDWSGINNLLGRKGLRPGSQSQVVTYQASYQPNGNSYLCVYGWTRNPLVEYYIVDSWGSWRPPGGEGHMGTVSSDGGTYDLYRTQRVNQPSIDGNTTFYQYWSVRTAKRTSGTITVGNHFAAWRAVGLDLGSLYEVSMTVEGYQSSGRAEVKMSMR